MGGPAGRARERSVRRSVLDRVLDERFVSSFELLDVRRSWKRRIVTTVPGQRDGELSMDLSVVRIEKPRGTSVAEMSPASQSEGGGNRVTCRSGTRQLPASMVVEFPERGAARHE